MTMPTQSTGPATNSISGMIRSGVLISSIIATSLFAGNAAANNAAVEEASKAILTYMCIDQDVPTVSAVKRTTSVSPAAASELSGLLANTESFALGTYIGVDFSNGQPVSKITAKCSGNHITNVAIR